MTLLEVGQIIRPHGLRGEVVVNLVSNRSDRLDPGSMLHTKVSGQRRIPDVLEVVASRPFQTRHLVVFSGVASREDADLLRGVTLLAEPASDDDDALYVHELIGKHVVDQAGVDRGAVRAVEANPASDLLVLPGGALVPLRFVVRTDDRTIFVAVPDGLFE
ncbi:MAG TPA: ribosome maturation factor RimM [Acidimicrobiales bacterium]